MLLSGLRNLGVVGLYTLTALELPWTVAQLLGAALGLIAPAAFFISPYFD
jgi:hypothetical protein